MTLGRRTHSDQGVEMVEAARHLVPLILAARDEGEQIRRVPPRVAEALAESGLLQMFLPRSMGGPELAPLTVFRAIEEISKADGSIGWSTMIATDVSLVLGWLPTDIGRQLCGHPANFVALALCDHSGTPIPEMAAIVSEDTGILRAASIMPTGFIARV
jgi:indole-3-acetate monooxygenase